MSYFWSLVVIGFTYGWHRYTRLIMMAHRRSDVGAGAGAAAAPPPPLPAAAPPPSAAAPQAAAAAAAPAESAPEAVPSRALALAVRADKKRPNEETSEGADTSAAAAAAHRERVFHEYSTDRVLSDYGVCSRDEGGAGWCGRGSGSIKAARTF